jgi:hypothetical protein
MPRRPAKWDVVLTSTTFAGEEDDPRRRLKRNAFIALFFAV